MNWFYKSESAPWWLMLILQVLQAIATFFTNN